MSAVISTDRYFAADLLVHRGEFDVQVRLGAERGDIIAVIGPNGCGKSTTLQVISGLLRPDTLDLRLNGRTLADGTGRGAVPAHRRRIGLMGQDPLLFPHLTALENVAFGLRSTGVRKDSARRRAREWLERLRLAEFAGRRPAQLSGGQRQRVALARALAAEPDLLLLDEPLAAADVRTAGDVRQLLREHLREAGQTTVLVTHEVLDAAVLADRVEVMQDGRIVDSGPTARMLTQPGTEFGAALAGLNLIIGTAADAGSVVTAAGVTVTGLAENQLRAGTPAAAVFPPSAVVLATGRTRDSARNHWEGRVLAIEPGPSAVRVRLVLAGTEQVVAADVTPAAVAALPIVPQASVHVEVKATQVRLYSR